MSPSSGRGVIGISKNSTSDPMIGMRLTLHSVNDKYLILDILQYSLFSYFLSLCIFLPSQSSKIFHNLPQNIYFTMLCYMYGRDFGFHRLRYIKDHIVISSTRGDLSKRSKRMVNSSMALRCCSIDFRRNEAQILLLFSQLSTITNLVTLKFFCFQVGAAASITLRKRE